MRAERLTGKVEKLIARLFRAKLDRLGLYWGTVQRQSGRKLEVKCDDQRVGGGVFELIALAPGATTEIATGARVVVGWLGGDTRYPVAWLFDGAQGTTVKLTIKANAVEINGDVPGAAPAAREGDATQGHQHTVTGNAGPYPIASGVAVQTTDTIAPTGSTVKLG